MTDNGLATAPTTETKKQVNVKLTAEARRLRAEIGKKLGIDQTAVIEIALREMAERKGIA